MNSGATTERVYDALKRRIMTLEFRPGDRLDPAVLAEPLAASVTPVRDALHMLAGERLVDARTANGFFMPALDEPALHDLYRWSAELLMIAIRGGPDRAGVHKAGIVSDFDSIADATADLFGAIARRSANREHSHAIGRLNDRMHAIRLAELQIIDAIEPELARMADAFDVGVRPELAKACAAYHRRRERVAGLIVRAVYRDTVR